MSEGFFFCLKNAGREGDKAKLEQSRLVCSEKYTH